MTVANTNKFQSWNRYIPLDTCVVYKQAVKMKTKKLFS